MSRNTETAAEWLQIAEAAAKNGHPAATFHPDKEGALAYLRAEAAKPATCGTCRGKNPNGCTHCG